MSINVLPDKDEAGNVIQRVRRGLGSDDVYYMSAFCFSFTATKNTMTQYDFKMTKKWSIKGGKILSDNHNNGDWIKIQIVDVDNVLGYGAGTILKTYVNDWYVFNGVNELESEVVADLPAANLYFRIEYTSTNLVNDTTIYFNCLSYEKSV